MTRHNRSVPVIVVLAMTLAGCSSTGSHSASPIPSRSTAQPSPTAVPAGTNDKIIGEDRSTPVITYTLPWKMNLGVVDRDDMFAGDIPTQANYVSPDGKNAVTTGLFSPGSDPVIFAASDAVRFDIYKNLAIIVTPLIEGTLGGGSMVAMSCHDRNGIAGRERLIVFSTTEGLAWILVATTEIDSPDLRKFLTSIKVLHPGRKSGWFKTAPAVHKSDNPGFPICETDAAKATIGLATDK